MCKLEKTKIKFEILKFKITLFTTILGASIFILLNKAKLAESVDILYIYIASLALFSYGIFGYVSNIVELNNLKRSLDE